jgi:hypothetical protein
MDIIKLSTPYGDHYNIDLANGNIWQDRDEIEPSGQWKFAGFAHVKRNTFISLEKIQRDPALLSHIKTWKNGNPQWTVADIDHGTSRIWGNTKHHGVLSVYLVKE